MKEWNGIYQGVVAHTRNTDAWVQLQVPQVLGTALTTWAMPMGFVGAVAPSVGTRTLVLFLAGDLNHPVYIVTSKSGTINTIGVGPTGPAGPTGPTGATGATGPSGGSGPPSNVSVVTFVPDLSGPLPGYNAGAVDINSHPYTTFAAATMVGNIVTLVKDITYEVGIFPTYLVPHDAYVVLPMLPVITNAPEPSAWTALTVSGIDCVYPLAGVATVTAESTDYSPPDVFLTIELGAGPGTFSAMPKPEDTPWVFAGAVSIGQTAPQVCVAPLPGDAFNDFLNYSLGSVPMYLILNIGYLGTDPIPPPYSYSYHAEVTLDLSLFAYRVTWTG
jgi:hypothetical protein